MDDAIARLDGDDLLGLQRVDDGVNVWFRNKELLLQDGLQHPEIRGLQSSFTEVGGQGEDQIASECLASGYGGK